MKAPRGSPGPDGVGERPGSAAPYFEPVDDSSHVADDYQRDYFHQADVYEAALETMNDSPTGNGQIAGLFGWGNFYLDN